MSDHRRNNVYSFESDSSDSEAEEFYNVCQPEPTSKHQHRMFLRNINYRHFPKARANTYKSDISETSYGSSITLPNIKRDLPNSEQDSIDMTLEKGFSNADNVFNNNANGCNCIDCKESSYARNKFSITENKINPRKPSKIALQRARITFTKEMSASSKTGGESQSRKCVGIAKYCPPRKTENPIKLPDIKVNYQHKMRVVSNIQDHVEKPHSNCAMHLADIDPFESMPASSFEHMCKVTPYKNNFKPDSEMYDVDTQLTFLSPRSPKIKIKYLARTTNQVSHHDDKQGQK